MKYLKRYNFISENKGTECDFDTFKEIMYELTDNYNDTKFNNYEDIEGYYECKFNLFKHSGNDIDYDLPRIDIIGDVDNPENLTKEEIDTLCSTIQIYRNSLLDFKSNIDKIIENSSEIEKVLKSLKNILPRFEYFSNFKTCSVGIDENFGDIIITFDTTYYDE